MSSKRAYAKKLTIQIVALSPGLNHSAVRLVMMSINNKLSLTMNGIELKFNLKINFTP